MSKYTLMIKKDARKFRTPLFETNNNTIGLEMQQKEVKICGGGGEGTEGPSKKRKNFPTWALSLVKCVAVWVPMLTHIQAPHTDALKTHVLKIFSFQPAFPGKFPTPAASFLRLQQPAASNLWRVFDGG